MKIRLIWRRPVVLDLPSATSPFYQLDRGKVPLGAGIYVFGRLIGSRFTALCVGRASCLRTETSDNLKTIQFTQWLKDAGRGVRVLLTAEFIRGRGQDRQKCLKTLEQGLISYFLGRGDLLADRTGVPLSVDCIDSRGTHFDIPDALFVAKAPLLRDAPTP